MTTPYQAPAAPAPAAAGYTSPIPITPVGFGGALRSEWTKIRTVRSTLWTLGLLVVLVVGIGLLVASLASGHVSGSDGNVLSFGFFGVLLGSLCVLTLGVLTITSEYGTGMIRTTMTASPSRGRVLAAKATVFTALTFVVTTVCCTLVALADNALLGGGNSGARCLPPSPAGAAAGSGAPAPDPAMACGSGAGAVSPTTQEWIRATLGIGLYVALLGLLALAVGAILRHTAGAVTTMLGVVLLPLILALFLAVPSLEHVRNALIEYCVPNQLMVLYDNPFVQNGPHGWDPLYILAAVTAVALGGAYALFSKRDV